MFLYKEELVFENGFFLYCIAQPGEAFISIKIAYHVFHLTENCTIETITKIPRMVIAYKGEKTLTVIQLSLTFNDHLKYSKELFSKLATITNEMQTFFINKPIGLNQFTKELFK